MRRAATLTLLAGLAALPMSREEFPGCSIQNLGAIIITGSETYRNPAQLACFRWIPNASAYLAKALDGDEDEINWQNAIYATAVIGDRTAHDTLVGIITSPIPIRTSGNEPNTLLFALGYMSEHAPQEAVRQLALDSLKRLSNPEEWVKFGWIPDERLCTHPEDHKRRSDQGYAREAERHVNYTQRVSQR